MVTVAKAVIHEDAVVIELLDTAITKITVVSVLRSQCLTWDANIVQVVIFSDKAFQ